MREASERLCFPGGLGELEKGKFPPEDMGGGVTSFWKTIFKLNSEQSVGVERV